MKLYIAVIILFLLPLASSQVYYDVELDEESVDINTSIVSECSTNCPGLQWRTPEEAEIIKVKDDRGDIDYTKQNNVIEIPGEVTTRNNRTIRIEAVVETPAEEIYNGLYTRSLSLPSFEDKQTQGLLKNDNIISGTVRPDFETSFKQEKVEFDGKGPGNAEINFGEGNTTEYYKIFGEDIEEIDTAFRVAIGTTEIESEYKYFAVALMPEHKYEANFDSWSAGTYSSGVIALRENLEDQLLPVTAHETVHALNHHKLEWDETDSAYFDEGVAEYSEFLMTKKLYSKEERTTGPGELFGDEKRYDDPEDQRRYYKVPPRGDREDLWEYYRNDKEFMKEWSPNKGDRDLGYPYSQLIVRYYVKNNGSLAELYESMPSESIDSYEEKWDFFSKHMEMEPCNYDERERFESCLEQINSFEYEVNTADHDFQEGTLDVGTVTLPNRTKESSSAVQSYNEFERVLNSLLRSVQELTLVLAKFF